MDKYNAYVGFTGLLIGVVGYFLRQALQNLKDIRRDLHSVDKEVAIVRTKLDLIYRMEGIEKKGHHETN